MSTTILTYPNLHRHRQTPAIGLITILIIMSAALITGAILVIVSSPTRDAYQTDVVPVAIAVPTPPITVIQLTPVETPIPVSNIAYEPSAVPVPVPTPPVP